MKVTYAVESFHSIQIIPHYDCPKNVASHKLLSLASRLANLLISDQDVTRLLYASASLETNLYAHRRCTIYRQGHVQSRPYRLLHEEYRQLLQITVFIQRINHILHYFPHS